MYKSHDNWRNNVLNSLGAICILLALASVGRADTIGINLNNGQFTLLDPADVVGAVPTPNWNNFANNDGLGLINLDPTDLVDDSGDFSDATITWDVGASFFNSNNGVGNQRMMEGWFGLNAGDDGFIAVEDLPSVYTNSTYDVYVYYDSDQTTPNERTMTFTIGDTSIEGKEMPLNFGGVFYEASDGSIGNYVLFRDLDTSSFTLTADSDAGRAAITGIQISTEPEAPRIDPPVIGPDDPIHLYDAANVSNTAATWFDSNGTQNWGLASAELNEVQSPNTKLSSAYRLTELAQGFGGDTAPFPAGDMTYELWVRPDGLTEDNQVIFETGGGQNGTSILMTEDEVRLLNSTGNERLFDVTVPLTDIDTSDFVQIVAALNDEDGEITLAVNGSAGGSASKTEIGDVGRGGNRASLFTWGSGLNANLGNPEDAPGGTFNLGGRTELPDMTPEGLTQFSGEIGLIQVFNRTFSAEDIQDAFEAQLAEALPGDYNSDGMLDVDDLNLQADAIESGDLAFDEDNDGDVDREDRKIWVKDYRRTWVGDADLDGEFTSGDFVAVFTVGKYEKDEAATWAEGDWDGDKRFGTADFVFAFSDGGYELGPLTDVQAVPEPSGLGLLLMGLGLLATRIRIKRLR